MASIATRRRDERDVLRSSIIVTVVVAATIIAFVGVSPPDPPRLVEKLALVSSAGYPPFTDPMVGLSGQVYNYGEKPGPCTIHYTISDSRGWSMNDIIELEDIEPYGGFAMVFDHHYWPETYAGQSLHGPSGDLVPTWNYTLFPA